MGSDLLTVAEVAELLRVTERTVRAWTRAGTLRAVKIGGRVRYRAATLDAMLDALEGGAKNDEVTSRA